MLDVEQTAPPALNERLARWVELTEQKRLLEAQLRKIQDELTSSEETLLEDFTLAGFQSVNLNGFTLYKQREFFCKVKEGVDKSDVIDAFRKAGLSHALGGPNYQTMRALAREWSEEGEGVPSTIANFVEVGDTFRLRARKS